MVKVSVVKQSNYPVGTAKIKKKLAGFLIKSGIVSDAEVSVVLVGEKKMMEVVNKYMLLFPGMSSSFFRLSGTFLS